ncbi:MAG: hypothetical protein QOJ16_619 [Acidobacteriota bacterium]|jgi:hypothetical protein|nr:hypothetical protein [Acidobacteriota bacterium]
MSIHIEERPILYGLMAEFDTPEDLIRAVERVRATGFRQVEAYTPYPIEEVSHALGLHHSWMSLLVLIGGILGGTGGYLLQYWVNLYAYPMNVGGRPMHSWPAFIVPTFECTILMAALFAVFGMFALNGLPQPYHPVFNVPRFAEASRAHFFLVIKAADPRFDRQATEKLLSDLNPSEVAEVEV